MGNASVQLLRRELERTSSAEVRFRLSSILEHLEKGRVRDPQALRSARIIQALEQAGTREVRTVLEWLSKGSPEADQTLEARAALARTRNGIK